MLHGYLPLILEGLRVTVLVAVCSFSIAIGIGLICAIARLRGGMAARSIVGIYTVVMRGVPELVLLLLVYFGLPSAIQLAVRMMGGEYLTFRLELPSFSAGVFTLSLIYGAYATEVFRGAIEAIPRGQIEAGLAYGMRGLTLARFVILPQMLRFAVAGLGNLWLVLLKATALVSAIQLGELMRASKLAAAATAQPFTFYLFAACIYLTMTAVSLLIIRRIGRKAFTGEQIGVP